MTSTEIVRPWHPPPEHRRIPSERDLALLGLWNSPMRIRWEVPLPVALAYWLRINRGHGHTAPEPDEGPFGRWFWKLDEEQRQRFFAPNGFVPPALGRTMVKLLVLSLGLKFTLWELPEHFAELLEQAQEDLFNGAIADPAMVPHFLEGGSLIFNGATRQPKFKLVAKPRTITASASYRQLKLFE